MELKEFIIYSTPSCGYCKQLKSWLSENEIPFTDYDVSQNTEKRKEMVEKSGHMAVPVSRVVFEEEGNEKEEVVVGFNKGKFSELLGLT